MDEKFVVGDLVAFGENPTYLERVVKADARFATTAMRSVEHSAFRRPTPEDLEGVLYVPGAKVPYQGMLVVRQVSLHASGPRYSLHCRWPLTDGVTSDQIEAIRTPAIDPEMEAVMTSAIDHGFPACSPAKMLRQVLTAWRVQHGAAVGLAGDLGEALHDLHVERCRAYGRTE